MTKEINDKLLEILQMAVDAKEASLRSHLLLTVHRFSGDAEVKKNAEAISHEWNKEGEKDDSGQKFTVFTPEMFKKKAATTNSRVVGINQPKEEIINNDFPEAPPAMEKATEEEEDHELVLLFEELRELSDKDLVARFRGLSGLKSFAKEQKIKIEKNFNTKMTVEAVRSHIEAKLVNL